MAVKTTVLYNKILFITGSVLLFPVCTAIVWADDQFSCRPSANGGWDCSTQARNTGLPPKPMVSLTPEDADQKVAVAKKPKKKLASDNKGLVLTTRSQDYSHLDWVPRDKLTPAQLAEMGPYCDGRYIEPARVGMHDKTPLQDAPTFVSADTSRYNQDQQIGTLAGNVLLQQGSVQAEADEANLYRTKNVGDLEGNVRLRDTGAVIVGDKASVELATGEAQVDNAEFVVHQSNYRGNARYVKRNQDGIIRLKDGTFTRCEPSDNTWTLHGNNIVLNRETGRGTATNATLRVKDIPVMYTPFISFPIDKRRQSGFLMPSFSSSSDNGFTLSTPYYFNLAPNYDFTLYPQMMAKRGLLMEGQFRYLTKTSQGQVAAAYLDDNGDTNHNNRKIYGEQTSQRWMYSWNNKTGLDSRWLAEVDYTRISDPFYFEDLNTNSLGAVNQVYVNQKGKLTYRGDNFTAAINLHAYQMASVTDITGYNRLPQLTLDGKLPYQPMGLNFKYNTEFVRFDRDLEHKTYYNRGFDNEPIGTHPDMMIRGLMRANGNRTYVAPEVSYPMEASWGYLTPSVQYAYTNYDLDLDHRGKSQMLVDGYKFKSNVDRSIPIYKVDSGLYFDRNANWFGTAFRQTLEPRAMYLYVPYHNQKDIPIFDTKEETFNYDNLFNSNRFSGRDRIGDTNQVSLGLTSRLLEKDGFERQKVSIGQAYYFEDRKVQMPGIDWKDRAEATNSTSPIALQYLYRINKDWRVSADYNWRMESSKVESGGVMLHYQPESDLNKIINMGFRYRDDSVVYNQGTGKWQVSGDLKTINGREVKDYYRTKQLDSSVIWPIVAHWNLIGRWQYDYNRSRTLDSFGGFEYDSCCWKLRLVGRYWQKYDESFYNDTYSKPDRGIFLQIVFKGLGSVYGNSVDGFMNNGIEGYRRRENQDF